MSAALPAGPAPATLPRLGRVAGIALFAVACALVAPHLGPYALAAWCALQALVFGAIDYHWRRTPRPS